MKRSIFAPPPVVKVHKDKLQHINDLDMFFIQEEALTFTTEQVNGLAKNRQIPILNQNTKMNYTENNSILSYESGIKAVTQRSYIVGSLSTFGEISFSNHPTLHITKEKAKHEADRLARQNPGKTFVYAQFMGAVASNSVQYF